MIFFQNMSLFRILLWLQSSWVTMLGSLMSFTTGWKTQLFWLKHMYLICLFLGFRRWPDSPFLSKSMIRSPIRMSFSDWIKDLPFPIRSFSLLWRCSQKVLSTMEKPFWNSRKALSVTLSQLRLGVLTLEEMTKPVWAIRTFTHSYSLPYYWVPQNSSVKYMKWKKISIQNGSSKSMESRKMTQKPGNT